MLVFLSLCQAADSPHMVSVPVTWVKEGGMVRLDKKYLQTDYTGVSSDDIVYTIQAAEGQPKYGTRLLVSPVSQCLFLRIRSLFNEPSSRSR